MKVSDLNDDDKSEALLIRMENRDDDCLIYLNEIKRNENGTLKECKVMSESQIRFGEKMIKFLNKSYLAALLAVLSLGIMNSSLIAEECCDSSESNRIYIGAFGGGIFSNSTSMYQMGTVFFPEADGGPLAVYARGHSKETSSGFGGVQIGYEWLQCPIHIGGSDWTITPGIEFEAYWFRNDKKGHLINSTERLPEHDFLVSFNMDMGAYLASAVFSLNNSCLGAFSPYIGGGIGAVHLSLRNAKSIQTSPQEPGINHFNSKRSDSSSVFAAQAKAGLRYNICRSFHIFGEYRYLFVDSSNYIFGSTVYPTHAPTTPWNVKVQNIHYNAVVAGIQYDL